jgi:hypothetical protein
MTKANPNFLANRARVLSEQGFMRSSFEYWIDAKALSGEEYQQQYEAYILRQLKLPEIFSQELQRHLEIVRKNEIH